MLGGMRTGFMLGSMIGVFAGMFLSSKSAHKMKDELGRTYEDTKRQIRKFADETTDNATETWENIQDRMYSTVNETMDEMSHMKSQMEIGDESSFNNVGTQIAHKVQTRGDKAKTDALVQAFLASDGIRPKKGK